MSVSLVWCGIMTVESDTKLVKNSLNSQFAELRWIFAESLRTFAGLYLNFAGFESYFAELNKFVINKGFFSWITNVIGIKFIWSDASDS
jgi:hypothetical protein